MIDQPQPGDERNPRLLIMDNTPLSLLSSIDALDWLFVPGCEVWITDMVLEEALRDPGEGRDTRRRTRAAIAAWLRDNSYRIRTRPTSEGASYAQAMELWRRAGSPPELRPHWRDRGERSLFSVVQMARTLLAPNEAIIALVDDRDARDALRTVRADIDMMGTQTFIRWMAEDFAIEAAETAWNAILIATNNNADPGDEEDPVYIRRRS